MDADLKAPADVTMMYAGGANSFPLFKVTISQVARGWDGGVDNNVDASA